VTSDAAVRLGVSVDTIRRDLAALEELGHAQRVHGGAVRHSTLARSFRERSRGSATGTLAQAVADRVRPGQVIGIDAGSTGVEVARRIPADLELTVVTTSPPAAVALEGHRRATVFVVGGILDHTWMAITGADAVKAIESFHFDLVVLGVCAVHPDAGATTNSLAEVETKRAWIGAAAETFVPVGHEKLDRVAPFVVCELGALSTLVCPSDVSGRVRRRYRRAGLHVLAVGA